MSKSPILHHLSPHCIAEFGSSKSERAPSLVRACKVLVYVRSCIGQVRRLRRLISAAWRPINKAWMTHGDFTLKASTHHQISLLHDLT